ncbi:MAG: hypothetical protein LQ344_006043 [Seirophora lacunosa]|nr:MAG: hypothetical protein LQ344_006043 [Seirophora lacunosa]
MSKTIIYTGAPLAGSLNWTDENLTAPLQPCFSNEKPPHTRLDPRNNPKWRSLPFEQKHLPTGLTQATNPDFLPDLTFNREEEEEETSFLSSTALSLSSQNTNNPSQQASSSEILTQYYEHSFAAHDTSQILPVTSSLPSSSPSAASSRDESTANEDPTHLALLARFSNTVTTDLRSMPTAAYLHSITPQTMTVNLLVGIIALPPARTITTRREKSRTVDLIEMIVGDDTRAGFGVNIWLPPDHHPPPPLQQQQLHLGEQIRHLRPRDVVLMRNVALTSFRGKVYGQSLRRGMTSVEVVWRSRVEAGERKGLFERWEVEKGGKGMEKVGRVREWVLRFVGGGGGKGDRDGGGKDGGGGGRRILPADTQ